MNELETNTKPDLLKNDSSEKVRACYFSFFERKIYSLKSKLLQLQNLIDLYQRQVFMFLYLTLDN